MSGESLSWIVPFSALSLFHRLSLLRNFSNSYGIGMGEALHGELVCGRFGDWLMGDGVIGDG